MPRFVLLFHDCPPRYERPSHWDLMLESGESLSTWYLAQLPSEWAAHRKQTAAVRSDCSPLAGGHTVDAVRLADHRLDYLELEGPLSGDRGRVFRIDRGTYERQTGVPSCWRLSLVGGCWEGTIELQQAERDSEKWILTATSTRS